MNKRRQKLFILRVYNTFLEITPAFPLNNNLLKTFKMQTDGFTISSNLFRNEDKRGKSAPYLLIYVAAKFLSGFLYLAAYHSRFSPRS